MTIKRTLPTDGTPLRPATALAEWRAEAPATPLHYHDGHDGLIITRYGAAAAVLADPRFAMQPQRYPSETALPSTDVVEPATAEDVFEYHSADLLTLDGPDHLMMRRAIMARFSVRVARRRQEVVAAIVREALEQLKAAGSPANLTELYAEPISAANHCHLLGIPDKFAAEFTRLFVRVSTHGERVRFIRTVIAAKQDDPGDDMISDLLASGLPMIDIEGLCWQLMVAGRDSIAFTIATTTVALLTSPGQLQILRERPELLQTAVEEFVRYGTVFVTLFPRTAKEDLEVDGIHVRARQTVAVSPTAANRDPERFERPDEFDVTRDASGHLGFGDGPHGCVGQQVARVVIREAIAQLIAELPELHLVSAEQLAPMPFAHPVAVHQPGSVIVAW